MSTIYQQQGYANRRAYLEGLAEDYGQVVFALAEILGPDEDFDGLVTELDDYAELDLDEDGDFEDYDFS